MPLGMIFRRLWRERRLLSILLLAICLVTGFFALGPLYVRAVSEAGVRYIVENTAPEQLNIVLSNPEPIGPEVWDLLNRELGGAITGISRSARSSGVVCGFRYTIGEPTTIFTANTPNCYQIASYSNFDELFTLNAGRLPVRLAPPDQVSGSGLSAAEQSEQQLGNYSRGEVEAVVSTVAAETADIEIGERIVVGDEPTTTAIVRIVGFVDPILPADDPFWEGQRLILTGQSVPINLFQERFDFGLIIPEGVYEDWIAGVTGENGNSYLWRLQTDPEVIHADTLDALEAGLTRSQGAMQAAYPNMLILSGLETLVENFREGVAATEGPVVLLSGAVLLLMLYHLVTTVALVLEQQSGEWSSMSSRGASIPQLIGMQVVTMTVLGLLGFVLGPIIAQLILLAMERVGPLAITLGGASLGVRGMPPNAILLSLFAALASIVVLTLPAWPAARRSLLRLKQLISRPAGRSARTRVFIFATIIGGLALMFYTYFMVMGNTDSFSLLFEDPAALIRLLASQVGAQALNDPFSLAGPALLLTGVALLWLEIFPLIIRLANWLLRGLNGLTVPLALWNVERNPSHYAQLVLLLIGTLALGTASLALGATRDVGAWSLAQQETGGYARLDLAPRQVDSEQDWRSLPEVIDAALVMAASTVHRAGSPTTYLFGVDPAGLAASHPELANALAPLEDTTGQPLPGLLLPGNTAAVTLLVYAEASPDQTTQTGLTLHFVDALGVPLAVPMTALDNLATERFVTYTAALPEGLGRAPWRLAGFQMTSRRGDLQDFTHTVYLDDVMTVDTDGASTLVADFESELPGGVELPFWQQPGDLSLQPGTVQAVSGTSLQVDYRVRQAQGRMLEPLVWIAPAEVQPVPVVVSQEFAEQVGRRTDSRQPLRVGDSGTVDLEMETGRFQMAFRVVGITRDFPTMIGQDRFLVARVEALRPVLNSGAGGTVHQFYDLNQVWLELASREPGEDFGFAALGTPGVLDAVYAWDRYHEIQRDPLPNAITGMLFAGFWVSLGLSVLDFAFYLAVTARQRALSFAVLRAMGWEARNVWGLLTVEQMALVTPALLVGVGLGALLAYLLLPFLALVGGETLRLPLLDVVGLLAALLLAFTVLLVATAVALRRMSVNQVLRLGEE